jgi:hypothetical protein
MLDPDFMNPDPQHSSKFCCQVTERWIGRGGLKGLEVEKVRRTYLCLAHLVEIQHPAEKQVLPTVLRHAFLSSVLIRAHLGGPFLGFYCPYVRYLLCLFASICNSVGFGKSEETFSFEVLDALF